MTTSNWHLSRCKFTGFILKRCKYMRYCGRQKNGKALLLTDDEIINNALEQEKSGIKPHYAFYDYKNHEKMTPAGWLVWSLGDGGCGVVYRRKDGKMIIPTGLPTMTSPRPSGRSAATPLLTSPPVRRTRRISRTICCARSASKHSNRGNSTANRNHLSRDSKSCVRCLPNICAHEAYNAASAT